MDMGISRRRYSSGETEPDVKRSAAVVTRRTGLGQWCFVALSILGSAAVVAAVGCFCALLHPILKELRAERVRGRDGTEERMLDFWSVLAPSALAGCVCCVSSWTLAYLDSYQPGVPCRDTPGHGFRIGCSVAVLNGVMGALAVIWGLT